MAILDISGDILRKGFKFTAMQTLYEDFLVSRDGWAALPPGASGLSAVCDCGIS